MTSIRLRLLKWLVGPILLLNLAGASLTYLLAWTPAQVAFDQGLLEAAAALAAQVRSAPKTGDRPRFTCEDQQEPCSYGGFVDNSAGKARFSCDATRKSCSVPGVGGGPAWFAVRGADGRLLAGDPDFPARAGHHGVYDAVMRGEPVRVALHDADGVQVGVARALRQRDQVRSAILRSLVLFEALVALALVGLVWFSVTNGLAPLARLSSRFNAGDSAGQSPIDTAAMPSELVPLANACNAMLERVGAATRAQDEFMANVTHQLRTPLAGLKLQLEWLGARHRDDLDTTRSVTMMLQANERMIRQTNQLLTLGRAEPSRFERTRLAPLDMASLVGEAVQGFVEQAASRQIDLGFELERAPVTGDRFLLRDLIDNLVDNALRYTPEGGSVTVRCSGGPEGSVLVVEDSGPGIAPEQRERAFERFVRLDERTTGSGLGLAIVRDVAQVHDAQVTLGARADGPGAVFTVHFPA